MPKIQIESNQSFGDWTAIEEVEPRRRPGNNKPLRMVKCRCVCGAESTVQLAHLRTGASSGCGCRKAKECSKRLTRHGESGNHITTAYRIWRSMISRCYIPSATGYSQYGAVGVTVCDRWRNSFENFISDMGRPAPGQSIDRFPEKAGNYELANCRWASNVEQGNNTRSNINISFLGRTMTLAEAGREAGVNYHRLHYRVRHLGMPVQQAIDAIAKSRSA